VERQHAWGKLTARERLDLLLDPGSLVDYCYIASPQSMLTGVRSFSGGASGAIYTDPSGVPLACPPPPGTQTIS